MIKKPKVVYEFTVKTYLCCRAINTDYEFTARKYISKMNPHKFREQKQRSILWASYNYSAEAYKNRRRTSGV